MGIRKRGSSEGRLRISLFKPLIYPLKFCNCLFHCRPLFMLDKLMTVRQCDKLMTVRQIEDIMEMETCKFKEA